MKALSQGLVKGRIDEVSQKYFSPEEIMLFIQCIIKVDQRVMLTWVQPRVLDRQQLATMSNKIGSWCQSVQDMEMMIENKAGEILTY